MMHLRLRLRTLVVLAFLVATAAGLLTASLLAIRFLELALQPRLGPAEIGTIIGDFRDAIIVYSIVALLLTAILAFVGGTVAARWVTRLRADTIARARGDERPPAKPPVRELEALATAVDILVTDHEDRETSLRRQRDELALLANSVSEGILLVGPGTRIIHANPAVRELLGLPDDCRGEPLPALVRSAELRQVFDQLGSGSSVLTTEVTLGGRRLLVTGRAVPTPAGAPATGGGAVVALIDLTELRRLEGVRRDFVANVSHELKTPLTSIRGYAETLLGDDVDPALQRQFLEVIQKNADRLHTIVDDLLDLSRLESGGWRPEIETLSPAAIAHDVWSSFAERARTRHVRFIEPAGDALVSGDESALRQILSNLFDNALRYTGPGGSIRVRITPAGETGGAGRNGAAGAPMVTIEVQDTGSGIPGDDLPRIFERFYRVDPARSRAEGGTGLGLSIVKHLVDLMHGEVTANSELGKGTTLRVRLPAARNP